MSHPRLFLLVAAACFALVDAVAHDAVYLPSFEVKGRESSLQGVAMSASQGFVGGEDLELQLAASGSDILEAVPGMTATQHSGSGKAKQYFLRGFNLDHGTDFAAFVDGMPVNMPTHGHGQGYLDTNFVIPEFVSMVSYLKGPYYSMIGDFASSGSASFQLSNVLEYDALSLELGEHGRLRLVGGASRPALGGELLSGIELESNDGPWDLDENLRKRNALVRYSKDSYDQKFSLTLMAYESSWNASEQLPERAIKDGRLDTLSYVDPTVGGESSRYSLSANWRRDEGHRRDFASAYAVAYQLDLWSNFTYFLDDPEQGDQFEQADDRQIYGATIGRTYFYQDLFGKQTNHTFSLQLRRDSIDEVGLYKTVERRRRETIREDEVGLLSGAIAYEAKIDWSPKLKSYLGLRYDRVWSDVDSRTDSTSVSSSDEMLSPKANFIYTFDDSFEMYVSAGSGFHSNDARALALEPDAEQLARSWGRELGFRWFLSDFLNTSLALWELDLDSELVYVGDAGETEASTASRRRGLDWTSFLSLGEAWSLDLDLALCEARFRGVDPGQDRIPGVIEEKLGGSLSYHWSEKGRASLNFQHLGKRPLDESGSVWSDAADVLGFSLQGKLEKWDWSLELANALDARDPDVSYFYESRLPGETDSFEDVHTRSVKPRSLSLKLRRLF